MDYKYSIVIIDDEIKFWVDDFEDLTSQATTVRYYFKNKKQLLKGLEDISHYEGFWCYLIDENNNTLMSGAFDNMFYEYVEEEL